MAGRDVHNDYKLKACHFSEYARPYYGQKMAGLRVAIVNDYRIIVYYAPNFIRHMTNSFVLSVYLHLQSPVPDPRYAARIALPDGGRYG